MLNTEGIIKKIVEADEVELMEFDFSECFNALKSLHFAALEMVIEYGKRDGSTKDKLLPPDKQSPVVKKAMIVLEWDEQHKQNEGE